MKTIKYIIFLSLFMYCSCAFAQVTTNFNNEKLITSQGYFARDYKDQIDFELPVKDIKELVAIEEKEQLKSNETKPFQLAVPVAVDLNISKLINWTYDKKFAYGKFAVKLNGALSISINFDQFYLPKKTEMYVYNEKGNMITGPVTESENNPNKVWGSWVYKGEFLTIEIKTPLATKEELLLHSNNIAYGYKEVYITEVGGFGTSATCNINVLCPLGNGWEAERNSVSLILSDNGSSWCSGSMVMNTCNTNRPFYLTANHCYATSPVQNVSLWRFTFQAWSATCTPSQNSNGVTYNGSTLRANWNGSDFCLVELNNTPPANSGICYAGWNRNTNGLTQTTIIHHPCGDVMKISRDNDSPVFENFLGAQCWKLVLDSGATQGGSSGSPYFDQNHRIIAQHYGINQGNLPVCEQVNKFGGRFDISWTGGGSNATRLSNWLDSGNTGALTTNTTNVANLVPFSYSITGSTLICNSAVYSISNLPAGATVTWSIPSSAGSVLQLSQNTPSTNRLTITNQRWYSITTTLTASINIGCGVPIIITKTIANDNDNSNIQSGSYNQAACYFYNVSHPSQSGTLPLTQGTPVFLHQGCMTTITLNNMTGRTVSLASGSGQPMYWSYNNGTLLLQLPYGSGGIPFTFKITGEGACYEKSILFFSYSNNSRYTFAIAPNPVKEILTIYAKARDEIIAEKETEAEISKAKLQYEVKIFDISTNTLLLHQKSNKRDIEHQINVSKLRKGNYILQIIEGVEKQTIKFLKE